MVDLHKYAFLKIGLGTTCFFIADKSIVDKAYETETDCFDCIIVFTDCSQR